MIGFFIAIAVIIALVGVIAIRHDRRQRGLSSWSDGREPGNARMDNQTRADEWGA